MVTTIVDKDSSRVYRIAIAALTVVSGILLAALIACSTQMRVGNDGEYLAVYKYLMRRYPELICDSERKNLLEDPDSVAEDIRNRIYGCVTTDYGVSRDGDPYVSFTRYIYDARTKEEVAEPEKVTIYFQHPSDGSYDYSEAFKYW